MSNIGNIIAGAELMIEIAGIIADSVDKGKARDIDNERRGTLVGALADKLFFACRKKGHKLSIIIIRSTLNHDMEYRDGGYLDSAEIGGYGYSIYAIYWGWIRNNDPSKRGFHNWCVKGYSQQNDNIIHIDQ